MQAEDAALRLRQQGILTHISSKNSFVVSGYVTGAFKVGLWAVLDAQYKDACAYLADENHEVTSGLPEEELLKLESASDQHAYRVFNKFLFFTGLFFLALILTVLYITQK
ncbi:MAG: hypothetical protein R3E57_09465 [Porticoccaceae bacterium]